MRTIGHTQGLQEPPKRRAPTGGGRAVGGGLHRGGGGGNEHHMAAVPTVVSYVCGGEVCTFRVEGRLSKADFEGLMEGYCAHHNLPVTQLV